MTLDDINILDVGTKIQIAGAIWADGERVYLVPLPHGLTEEQNEALVRAQEADGWDTVAQGDYHYLEVAEMAAIGSWPGSLKILDMNLAEWQQFVRQTDLLETEVLAAHEHAIAGKIPKILLRKSQRQIAQGVSWSVYKRDGYRCRYCGIEGGDNGAVLTVDHIVLWEHGGPSIEENLVACCKRCNKVRGNTKYDQWLQHPYYLKMSQNLIMAAINDNDALLGKLATIPRMVHKPGKRK